MTRFNSEQKADSFAAIKDALASCTRDSRGQPIIYTVLRGVSKSGMMRRITPIVIVDGKPVSLAWHYDRAHGRLADDSAGSWSNKVGGCGMDMGYHHAGNIAGMAGLGMSFRHEWL